MSLDEAGSSGLVCVVKASGTVPTGGLTVDLSFLPQSGESQPSKSLHIAPDQKYFCITINNLCAS